MPRRPKTTNAAGKRLEAKIAGRVKVKHMNVKTVDPQTVRNTNQVFTANGGNNQGYDQKTKSFTKASGRSATGRLAVEGETNAASAKTHAMTQKDAHGRKIKQSGRSKLASRSQRYYDRRVAYYKEYRNTPEGREMMAQMKQGGVTRSLGFTVG